MSRPEFPPPPLPDLPVASVLDEIVGALGAHGSAVLVAPPGAGKTTLVPLALLGAGWLEGGKILLLEPRRLAARASAARMAALLREPDVGATVGYRVRMDTRVGPDTRIEVVTEGVLTRMLLDDPTLSDYGVVVFDEFHERSLQADLGLALVLQSRALLRPDLRVLVMSATLDASPVADLLGGAPMVRSEGRTFPVETRWRDRPLEGRIEGPVTTAILDALDAHEGDLLAFLPGAGEIREVADRLREGGLPGDVGLHLLFGSLSREEQDRAIAPSRPGRRKVVLATSIAETSLTIEGVRVVVDSGRMRVPRFDPGSGMTRLETVTVTRDAADQRRGRAGRTAPGVCHRLWTEAEDRGLVAARRPEILDADLASLALDLAVWGARPDELRWLTPPPEAALQHAFDLLGELRALDAHGAVTPHGREMAGLGVHPRLAHMQLWARAAGLGGVACDLGALLADRDILERADGASDPDLRTRIEVMRRARQGATHRAASRGRQEMTGPATSALGQRVNRGALDRALREARQFRDQLGIPGGDGEFDEVEQVGLLLAFAYPDRIARRREGGRGRFLLRNGKGASLTEGADPGDVSGLGDAAWIVAADVDARTREGRIFRAAPVDPADLEVHFGDRMRVVEEVAWDASARRVVCRRRETLGAITVREGGIHEPAWPAVRAALIDGIRAEGVRSLPWTPEREQLRDRLRFLHGLDPDRWPDRSEAALLRGLEGWLAPFLEGLRSARRLEDLAALDLGEALLAGVEWPDRARLDDLAPTHVEVPSGVRVPIDYGDPEAPTLAVRLQQVFGMTETPRVGGGRVPLTLHLLSPAHRPVQVTRDLASFWRDAYFEVRKDLRGRYPKHPWPEDPLTAEPTNRTKRR